MIVALQSAGLFMVMILKLQIALNPTLTASWLKLTSRAEFAGMNNAGIIGTLMYRYLTSVGEVIEPDLSRFDEVANNPPSEKTAKDLELDALLDE